MSETREQETLEGFVRAIANGEICLAGIQQMAVDLLGEPSPEAPEVEGERARCLDLTGRVVDEYARQTGDVLNEVVLLEAISAAGLFATTPQPEGAPPDSDTMKLNPDCPIHGDRDESGDTQLCGHPVSAIVSSDEGTSYCGMCEDEARERDESVEWDRPPEEALSDRLDYMQTRNDLAPWELRTITEALALLTALQEADEALEWAQGAAIVMNITYSAGKKDTELDRHAQALARLRELANPDM